MRVFGVWTGIAVTPQIGFRVGVNGGVLVGVREGNALLSVGVTVTLGGIVRVGVPVEVVVGVVVVLGCCVALFVTVPVTVMLGTHGRGFCHRSRRRDRRAVSWRVGDCPRQLRRFGCDICTCWRSSRGLRECWRCWRCLGRRWYIGRVYVHVAACVAVFVQPVGSMGFCCSPALLRPLRRRCPPLSGAA